MHLAIDIGGTKTLLALFSANGRPMKRIKFPTPHDPNQFVKHLKKNLNLLLPKRKVRIPTLKNVVVAIAGPVDANFSSVAHPLAKTLPTTYGKPLKYGNLPWHGFAFSASIEECIKNLFKNNHVHLPEEAAQLLSHDPEDDICCPIYIQNDANLAAYYEARNLPGKSIYLTYSTGVGGGIMIDGVLSEASYDFEPGHVKYIWQSKHTEYEDIASANALKLAYGVRATEITGRAGYQDIALRVSTGLTDIIRDHHPDYIIIGGALGMRLRYFKPYLVPILAASLYCTPAELPEIIAAEYPLESVIYGCYLYGSTRE